MWRTVQSKAGVSRPLQLLLDMRVRWSSTYVMLDRAEKLKNVRYVPRYSYWVNFYLLAVY